MKKAIIVIVALMVVISMTANSYAQDPGKKLIRGLANVLTGWVELPKNIYETSVEDNIFAGMVDRVGATPFKNIFVKSHPRRDIDPSWIFISRFELHFFLSFFRLVVRE